MEQQMAQKNNVRPEQAPPNTGQTDALGAFSAALAQRFPNRVIQRFTMPSNVRECREVFILEITSREEIQAATWTDSIMTPIERASSKLAAEAERRESIRLAIVGIGEARDGAIVYRHANNDGTPLAEISDWSSKAWAALHTYFGEVNGVPIAELKEGTRGAQIVGAFYAPKTEETPGGAAAGRSSASSGRST
jgi:FAD/FMN-containing dehydrogenase